MRLSILPNVFLSCSLLAPLAMQAQTSAEYKSDPKFTSAMAEGRQLSRQQQYVFAVDAFKKACKISAEKDETCLTELYTAQMKSGNFKDAAATASALEAIANNPTDKSYAEVKRGHALLYQAGDKNKSDILTASDAAFKAAIADNPKNGAAHYLDGQVLARLNQIDAARDQFKTCLTCVPSSDPNYLRAQHFAEDPALSTHKMAPAFTVTALDGSRFNLDAMGGRVVLIDFWATWCGPCNAELPNMKKIAKEFAGQPLVIISVSWDSDEQKWRDFINKNEMAWVQYRDADQRLGNLFGINSIPHYFTIDSDGVLTAEMLGEGSNVEGKLKKLIAKAKAASPAPTTQVGN
ncbi:MAG: TlpA disulfide reductase family protein [Edaphobacter sp.]